MGLATFKGGVHPYEGKELSADKPVQSLMPKGDLVFPMCQHIGAPATPLVAKGDQVLAGQKLGEANGFISANVICSVSGTVKAVEPRLTASGAKVLSVVVENDGEYRTVEGTGTVRDASALDKQQIRDMIKDAGIVGMGGAGFPTHVKLTPKDDHAIEYVIINGAECEPYLTSDYRLMMEDPKSIVEGLKVMLKLFDKAKGIIGIENNKPEAIRKMTELVSGEANIEVCTLKTKYPQGGERSLIYAVTGRKVNSSMLPADVGCIVDNVATAVAVYDAVCKSTPLMERIFTVTGDAVEAPQNFRVKLGTSQTELVEAAGGFKTDPEKIISGGPMMGQAMFTTEVPVTKTSSALLAFSVDEVAANAPTACIRCGRCAQACPSRLIPPMLMKAANRQDIEGFQKVYGMECMECGSCTYVCPARRPLTQAFREMKVQVRVASKKKA